MQTLPKYIYLLDHCMVPKSLSLMSTLSGTNCSAPNQQTLKDTNFLFVLTACSSTVSVPVTKQLFRKEHWMLSLKFHVRLQKSALAIDWMEGLPDPDAVLELMSCSCTCVCKPHSISALLMDPAVQNCAD